MQGKVKLISAELIREVADQAAVNPRCRQNYNFHDSPDDICQRLLNAMEPGSYIQPHRHAINPKPEMFLAVAGRLGLILFSDRGEITATHELAPSGRLLGVEIPSGLWHTVISLEKGSVFLEVKPGPYIPLSGQDFAAWAPAGGEPAATAYLETLHAAFGRAG
ncbi:MAG: WbuC family cupin fold metalloprotein [Nitrospiraceae bacterium]|nr:WbuC family cupin fold metalloprotein [Nitrospiraceae bacterium]